jgi:H+/gluconate symporter-like permease
MLASALIDLDALWKIVVAGFVGGAGVVVDFGFVLLGRSRYEQARQGDALTRATAILTASAGGAVCAAALIVGLLAMTKK